LTKSQDTEGKDLGKESIHRIHWWKNRASEGSSYKCKSHIWSL